MGQFVVLAAGLALAAAIRIVLLPTDGFRFDLDTFVMWAHDVAIGPLSRPYEHGFNLPPVMTYIWGILAAVQPELRTAVDGSDPGIRALMKAPASLADLGLALAVAWSLRDRPSWAVAAGLGIALHPTLIDDSAWWGQYEALYVLPAFLAWLFARAGRPVPAAVALGVSLMTKPQALPFLVPFAAWALRRLDRRQLLASAAALIATIGVLWLPFAFDGGLQSYVGNAAHLQGDVLNAMSMGAWNFWWLLQLKLAPGILVSDASILVGPLTRREIGLALAFLGEVFVFVAVWLRPSARRLAIGLACATLVAFSLLTAMHERYSFAALVFLAPLLPDRRILAIWLVLSVAITANMLATIPPMPEIGDVLPVFGPLSVAGSIAILTATGALLWLLRRADNPVTTPGTPAPA